jgi:hypothetical protein
MMSKAIKQAKTESDISTIVKSMLETKTSSHRDPCPAATKGFCQAFIPTSGAFIEAIFVGQKHEAEQAILCSFFERNPTPACVEEVMDSDVKVESIYICSGSDAATTVAPQPSTAHASATSAPQPLMVKDQQQEFFRQMVEILKQQAPPQQQKIVVE